MQIVIANKSHIIYANIICETIAEAAKVRGTGIAKRKPDYVLNNRHFKPTTYYVFFTNVFYPVPTSWGSYGVGYEQPPQSCLNVQ